MLSFYAHFDWSLSKTTGLTCIIYTSSRPLNQSSNFRLSPFIFSVKPTWLHWNKGHCKDHTSFIHALIFAGSQGSCLNTRPLGRVLKHRPRDPASVNAMKQTCVIIILAYFTWFQHKTGWKRLLKIKYPFSYTWYLKTKWRQRQTFERRHNVIFTRAMFSWMKASAKWSVTAATLSSVTSCMQIGAQFRLFQVKATFKQHVNLMIWTCILRLKQLSVTNSDARIINQCRYFVCLFVCLFGFILYVPVNNFSVMSGHNTVPPPGPFDHHSNALPTDPLHSANRYFKIILDVKDIVYWNYTHCCCVFCWCFMS